MTAIITPRGTRSEFLYTLSGQRIENVVHMDWGGTAPGSHLVSLNNSLISWWTTNIAPLLSNNLTLRAVRTTDLTSLSGSVVETAPSSPVTGGVAVESLPSNVALVMTQRTGLRGRSYRGRTYVPAIPSDEENTPTDIASADAAAMVAAWATLIAHAVADELIWAVLSTVLNKVQRSTGVLTPIVSVDGNTAFDSQRRRLAGRGN